MVGNKKRRPMSSIMRMTLYHKKGNLCNIFIGGAHTAFDQQRPKIQFHNHEITNIFSSRCSYQFNKSAPEIKKRPAGVFL